MGKPFTAITLVAGVRNGLRWLFREQSRSYSNQALHKWIRHWIYGDVPVSNLFTMQLVFGLVVSTSNPRVAP
jgi:hypothetical protein